MRTEDGGITWNDSVLPPALDIHGLADVTCLPSSPMCVAIGTTRTDEGVALVSLNRGETWRAFEFSKYEGLTKVSCADESLCMAIGYDDLNDAIFTSLDGANSWTELLKRPRDAGDTQDVSCASDRYCAISVEKPDFSGQVEVTNDAGSSWRQISLLPSVAPIGIACRARDPCFAVALDQVFKIERSTQTARGQDISELTVSVESIDCPIRDECFAVGGYSVISTEDGGTSWSPNLLPPDAGCDSRIHACRLLSNIACWDAENCLAVGSGGSSAEHKGLILRGRR